MTDIQCRVETLESKLAFAEHTIEILNDELQTHQANMAKMQRQLQLLAEKLKEVNVSNVVDMSAETPPPHY